MPGEPTTGSTTAQHVQAKPAANALKPTPQGIAGPALSEPPDIAAMDKHLVGGIAWTAAAKWSSQILTWVCLLIVARLLLPSDFGVVSAAGVYLGLVAIFSEFGFGSAVITLRDLTVDEIAQINTFSVISGMLGFLISCALAMPIGWFFRSAELPGVILVMSTNFLITGFKTVPNSLQQREFRFKRLSLIESLGAIMQSLCVLLLAWLGKSYWALALGSVVGALTATTLNVASRPVGFARPRSRSIAHALRFSWQVLVGRFSWNLYTDADFLVAGRTLGATALGAYSFAWNLATLPIEKVTALVGQVTPAFFAANQADPAGLRRYLQSLTEALSLITFPAAIGLGLVAPEFVSLVLGERWSGVVGPLQVLAFYASIRSVSALLGALLTALRETRFLMWINVMAVAIMPATFYVGSRWGASGIAWGWVIAYPLVALPLYARAFRRISMPIRTYLGAIRPALQGSLAMIVAVSVLKWATPPTWPLYVRFAMEVAGGGSAYLIVLIVLHADRMRAFLSLCRGLRAPRPAVPSADSVDIT
jgi:O-antigen/teichoic acid export membrane protein